MRLVLVAVLVAACGEASEAHGPSLRGDRDHDGELSEADDGAQGEVIFLANLDDDDGDLVRDGEDDRPNGEADLLDLAPVDVELSDAAAGLTGTLSLLAPANALRVLRDASPVRFPLTLTAAELRAGVRLLVEGIVPVGTPQTPGWDGTASLTLDLSNGEQLSLPLRVAPVLFQYNTAAPSQLYFTGGVPENERFGPAIREALAGAPPLIALQPPTSGPFDPVDPWTQDFFDVAHTSRPGPGGAVDMKIALRSAQPDRSAGQVVQSMLGPDFGYLEVHSGREPASDLAWSMNSFGNWEVIPPHPGHPLGRNVWGALPASPSSRPDLAFADFVAAQGVQGSLQLDTSWLVVGHVDEIVSFTDDGAGGFHLLAAAPELARQMLLDLQAQGHGGAMVFEGLQEIDLATGLEVPAQRTVDQILSDPDVMGASQEAQLRIDDAVATLAAEIGISTSDVVPFPFLFTAFAGRLTAYQPGTVNLLPVGRTLVMPRPFGPRIGGVDPFERDLEERLGVLGYTAKFVDDWWVYHVNFGEVHCATNAVRDMDVRFWEVTP